METLIIYSKKEKKWLKFDQPKVVLRANALTEIKDMLAHIDFYLNKGFHVAGFMSYEAASALDYALQTHELKHFPYCWFGVFEAPVRFNCLPDKNKDYSLSDWHPEINKEKYIQDIKKIKQYIKEGYTYQVNYTYKLKAEFKGDPFSFFTDIASRQSELYAAYIDIDGFSICSFSPELFFELEGENIQTRPMKGTGTRGRFLSEDILNAETLAACPKNRAENVMIVDMLRNDLGRVAQIGTVTVPELYHIETYPTVLQMTSTVQAKTNAPFSEILAALFPCASITGAPKPKTMQIIAELEPFPRNIYTGSIGYISPDRYAQFNVAIRTALINKKNNTVEYGVGGGIVWDSDMESEWQESIIKSKVLKYKQPEFDLVETLLWEPQKGFRLLDYHLKRLGDSARFFDYRFCKDKILDALMSAVVHCNQNFRVRLLLSKKGSIDISITPFEKSDKTVKIKFAETPVDSSNVFLFHKTTHRPWYSLEHRDRIDDFLFYNEKGHITETTIYNIVVEHCGKQLTPPITCGLLNGTYRQWLLDQGQVSEGILTRQDVDQAESIYLINSVRGWQKAVLVDNS